MATRAYRSFRSDDGAAWRVDVILPGSSSALVRFRSLLTPLDDRYAYLQSNGPESKIVTARLDAARTLESLSEADLARIYRRSLPVVAKQNPLDVPNSSFSGG